MSVASGAGRRARGRAARRIGAWVAACTIATGCAAAHAATYTAGPDDYPAIVRKLTAGDRLRLAPGTYVHGLDVHGLAGEEGRPITIEGAPGGPAPVFVARPGRNTVSIVDSAYVRIAGLDLVGAAAGVDAVKAEGHARYAHHIVLERLRITGYDASQQNVGISTKCPAWGWVIRDNRMARVGTGLYLGDSDGSAPFVRAVIERNEVRETLGYSMQIKHQTAWPDAIAVSPGDGETIIRYNLFSKESGSSSGEAARPNLLLGHWPRGGRGARDRYLVYGNRLVGNPTEFLFQAEGNVTVYNNVFVNRDGGAVALREHNDVPRRIDVFHNTILASGTALLLRHADPALRQSVTDNAMFAGALVPPALADGNVVRPYREAVLEAGRVVLAPGTAPARGGTTPSDTALIRARAGLPDVDLDIDRRRRLAPVAGAYANGTGAARPRSGR